MLIKSIMWDTNNDNEALASLPDEIETPNFLHQEDYKTMSVPLLGGLTFNVRKETNE